MSNQNALIMDTRNLAKWLCLILTFHLLISCKEDDGSDPVNNQLPIFTSTDNMEDLLSGDVIGTTTVNRFEDKISVQVNTSNLIPGHVYNLYAVTIDRPENCLSRPCSDQDWDNLESSIRVVFFYLTGWVAAGETHSYGNNINENDVTTFELWQGPSNDDYGGLQDALKAEVHIYIRSRGPVVGAGEQQLETVDGGCTTSYDFSHPQPKVPSEPGECGWVQQSIHLPPPD